MVKKKLWLKMRPDSNDRLEALLKSERTLQAVWYAKISGEVPWNPGERERLNAVMDATSRDVNAAISDNTVERFASLPAE